MEELKRRNEHITRVEEIGNDVIANKDKIEAIVVAYVTSNPETRNTVTIQDRQGCYSTCVGLSKELEWWLEGERLI